MHLQMTNKALGRPSLYTEEVVDEICARLSAGESLLHICRDDHLPAESTVRGWANDDVNGFFAKYSRARDLGLDHLAEETIEIADDGRNDTCVDDEGNEQVNIDHIKRSQLRVAARQWYVSKVAPKKYGDRQHIDVKGDMTNRPAQADPASVMEAMRAFKKDGNG